MKAALREASRLFLEIAAVKIVKDTLKNHIYYSYCSFSIPSYENEKHVWISGQAFLAGLASWE